jgi:copper resistance protein B
MSSEPEKARVRVSFGASPAVWCGVLGSMAAAYVLAGEPSEATSQPAAGVLQSPEPAASTPGSATAGEGAHVAPDPPQHQVADMSYRDMASMMQMDDTARTGKVLLDQFEWRATSEGNAAVWDAAGWYGGDDNKLWLKTEGERVAGNTQGARADLLWDHVFARWWNVQTGLREDFGDGPPRTWAAIGIQGLAPYWFDTEATFYVGEQGRTALRLKSECELLLTQRLILQPEGEANLYGKADPARQLGSGLADLEIGLRLRYEIVRQFAPYIGVVWSRNFGGTADYVRESGGDPSDVQFVVGLRAWF